MYRPAYYIHAEEERNAQARPSLPSTACKSVDGYGDDEMVRCEGATSVGSVLTGSGAAFRAVSFNSFWTSNTTTVTTDMLLEKMRAIGRSQATRVSSEASVVVWRKALRCVSFLPVSSGTGPMRCFICVGAVRILLIEIEQSCTTTRILYSRGQSEG